MKQYAAIDDTVYFWFAANTTSGSGGDGASPASDVRLAGAAADAAPVYSQTPTLLSHANYPAGAYEIAITASVANGFTTGNTYAVFCTLAIDSQNPTGFVGSFDTKSVWTTGTGGGGHCAWYDDDLNRANKFFKASPQKFKEILENLDSIKTKLSKVDSDSTIVDSINTNNSTLSDDLNTIRSSIAELSEGLKTTDSLLISMADAASLEELLDEA